MWNVSGFNEGSLPSIYMKEICLTYPTKTTHVETELCRDPNCSVRHVFPIDVVFSVSNKGPRKKWTLREEDTFVKRHLSELMAPTDATDPDAVIPVDAAWTWLQILMQKQGTYVKPSELDRYWTIIEQRKMIRQLLPRDSDNLLLGNDGLIAGTVEIYARVFEHLMFDSAYFEALRQCQRTGTISDSLAGTEKFRVGDTCPIVPGCLSAELRDQWMKDFTALASYALGKGLGTEVGNPQCDMQPGQSPKTIRKLDKGMDQKPPTAPSPTPPTKADAQREANKQLYQVNKELASANAALEARLDRVKATLGSLTTKIVDKTGEKVSASDPVERVSDAVRLLLLFQSENNDENKESDSVEVTLLSAQLQKMNAANATLQNELVALQNQLKELRQQKKNEKK
ncbi:hypothetical protein AAVH_07393 [Aphelenchoides avenae]|nr:hypothetical protein AAVH_07393 [Aphelenchus avenae]